MLRHAPTSSVASLLSNLRCHDNVSSLVGLVHSDLHVSKTSLVLEYLSSMVATVEPVSPTMDGLQGNTEDYNYYKGKLLVRMKRRNGRVRVLNEDFCIEQSGIKFMASTIDNGGTTTAQSLVPKVQFNLQLSEKERMERAKVILPFEHQGNGKPIDIYDGRRSLIDTSTENKSTELHKKLEGSDEKGKGGEIIYFRDSDDEMPDSDEDPDDDLDI